MKKAIIFIVMFAGLAFAPLCSLPSLYAQDTSAAGLKSQDQAILARIENLTGTKGEFIAQESVYKVGFPRSDLKLNISGVEMAPAMGLGVWAGFKVYEEMAMVMGDTVMTEDQVNPVMGTALDNGLEVTAIHNHFFWDNPKIMFMHIGGMGNLDQIASAVGKVFARIKDTAGGKAQKPHADIDPAKSTLDPKKIDAILGAKGAMSGGIYKITIGRTTTMNGREVGNAMGINTWAAFAGSDDKAVVDGDFVMRESEVQEVLKALRASGINVVALHNHMIMESPRMMFLHFWGVGPAGDLARGLKSALHKQGK